ncbi:MAG: anti-sigma factor domain-containing protein [Caldilineaceae bacterium]
MSAEDRNREDRNRMDDESVNSSGNLGETGSIHETGTLEDVRSLIPAYSIGALDPEDIEFVQERLAVSPEAAAELAEYASLQNALLHCAGERLPSAQLGGRLQASLRESRAPAIIEPARSWRERFASGNTQHMWVRWAMAGALALLIGLNVLTALRIRSLQEENRNLSLQLSNQREALALLTADGVQMARLPAASDESDAMATVRWTPDSNVAVVSAQGFPALEAGLAYQLWLIRDGERTSGGLFTVNNEGSGTLVVQAPDPIASFDAMGVTPEPATGSPGPTSPPVVVGPLSAG